MNKEKLLYWIDKSGKRHLGARPGLTNAHGLWGDCSNVYGDASNLTDEVTRHHTGHLGNLRGKISRRIRGELTGMSGVISMIGDVSGITGDITGFIGNATGCKICTDFIDPAERIAHPNIRYW